MFLYRCSCQSRRDRSGKVRFPHELHGKVHINEAPAYLLYHDVTEFLSHNYDTLWVFGDTDYSL